MERSLFIHTAENPYHLSVGAIGRNAEGKILCLRGKPHQHGLGDFDIVILMRESVEANESLEAAAKRGFLEEFGAEVELLRYLGAITCTFFQGGAIQKEVEKTTPYLLANVISIDDSKRSGAEAQGLIEWWDLEPLIEQSELQGKLANRADIDESKILKRLL